ncbi:MAG: bacillithiol biosynthesis deacetylase BshB1 [Candidatus Latescibacterota bacterium]
MRLLTIGIHPDDIELGCGGTVALAVQQGHEVFLVDLSSGDASSNGTPEERAVEAQRAAVILGVAQRINLGFRDAAIQSEDPEQTRAVVEAIRRVAPNVIIIPHKNDPHPDHASGGVLIERAIYLAGIHGYQTGTQACAIHKGLVYIGRLDFAADLIVDVTSTMPIKTQAIEAHRSQFLREEGRQPTPINSPEFLPFLRARSRSYGYRIGAQFGEPFQLFKATALKNFTIFES